MSTIDNIRNNIGKAWEDAGACFSESKDRFKQGDVPGGVINGAAGAATGIVGTATLGATTAIGEEIANSEKADPVLEKISETKETHDSRWNKMRLGVASAGKLVKDNIGALGIKSGEAKAAAQDAKDKTIKEIGRVSAEKSANHSTETIVDRGSQDDYAAQMVRDAKAKQQAAAAKRIMSDNGNSAAAEYENG